MSQTTQTLDVIIIGGGMVGGAAALALAELGLSIAIVEKNTSVINTQLPDIAGARVSAIQRSSEKLLKQLGVWEGIETRRITPFTQMHIQDWQGFETQLNAADLHEPNLGYIVENDVITAAIWDQIKPSPFITHFNTPIQNMIRLTSHQWQVVLDDQQIITAPLLIGADGAHSQVRQALGIEQSLQDYQQTCIVGTVQTEKAHQHICWQHYRPEAPFALLPLHHDHHCSIAWYLPESEASTYLARPIEAQSDAMTQASDGMLGKLTPMGELLSFGLIRRQSQHYIRDGALLMGDAAHTVHPQAGQGVNLGFLDVIALQQVIRHAQAHCQPIHDDRVLMRFERARRHDATLVQTGMESLNGLFSDHIVANGLRRIIKPIAQQRLSRILLSAPTLKGRLTGIRAQ